LNNNRNNRRRGRGSRNVGGNQSNRVDSRARGNAPQLLDKYKKLAQDAQHNGDRVQAEYYLQFADHYFRVIADARSRQDEVRPRRGEDRGDERDEDGDADGQPDERSRGRQPRRARSRDEGGHDRPSSDERDEDTREDTDEDDAPRRRQRRPATAAGERAPRKRVSRTNGAAAPEAGGDRSEIDASVLPPAIGDDDAGDAKDAA
jgi:hypothetical protein